jgi:thiamine-phosphate pyrophosphorylase
MTSRSAFRHPSSDFLKGLYLLLDEQWARQISLCALMREGAERGVSLFQYRCKDTSMSHAYTQARKLAEVAREMAVCFIVNDRCDLALAVEADGVHVGQQDLPAEFARQLLGPDKLVGMSTHNAEEVLAVPEGQVDYIGFGPIFQTGTKANHDPIVGIEGLQSARALTSLPLFAIGGISPESVSSLVSAGANGVAVASAVLGASTPGEVMTQFLESFSQASPTVE